MALKLAVKPGEVFVLNGALISNGEKRATLIIHNRASVLRAKDILNEDQADNPPRRVYHVLMLALLNQIDKSMFAIQFAAAIAQLIGEMCNHNIGQKVQEIVHSANEQHYYRAMMLCRSLPGFGDHNTPKA